jgi:hypothetical protein
MADAIARESKDSIQVDVDLKGAEASVNTTKKGWTITAYARRLWKGAFSGGLRVTKPLSLFSRD